MVMLSLSGLGLGGDSPAIYPIPMLHAPRFLSESLLRGAAPFLFLC